MTTPSFIKALFFGIFTTSQRNCPVYFVFGASRYDHLSLHFQGTASVQAGGHTDCNRSSPQGMGPALYGMKTRTQRSRAAAAAGPELEGAMNLH